jgi:hypothetical protein
VTTSERLVPPELRRPIYDPGRLTPRGYKHDWYCPVCGNPAYLRRTADEAWWHCNACRWRVLAWAGRASAVG